MSAGALLRRVRDAGGRVRVEGVELVVTAPAGAVTPPILDELRARKAQVLAIVTGDACRWCEGPIDWRRPDGVTFADGTAAHLSCDEASELARRDGGSASAARGGQAAFSARAPPVLEDHRGGTRRRAFALTAAPSTENQPESAK